MRILLALLGGCIARDGAVRDVEVVDEVWELVDTRYALFVDKDVRWPRALNRAYDNIDDPAYGEPGFDLEFVVIDMLERLRDGHVNLATPSNVSVTRAFLEGQPPTYDEDLVHRHVLDFAFNRTGAVTWAIPDDDWGYLRIDDFANLPSAGTLNIAFLELSQAPNLIVDLRGNGGGRLDQAGRIIGRFFDEATNPWFLQFSTGPAHDDLSEPVSREVQPVVPGFAGPVAVLCDGRTYSAANLVAFALAERSSTLLVGQATGGGGGSPTWHRLSNGWEVRFPTARLTGPGQVPLEDGIAVDIEVVPDSTTPDRDAMVEVAVERLLDD